MLLNMMEELGNQKEAIFKIMNSKGTVTRKEWKLALFTTDFKTEKVDQMLYKEYKVLLWIYILIWIMSSMNGEEIIEILLLLHMVIV